MFMKASEAIEIGRDVAPPIPPLSWALKDSFLTSRCTACFSQLNPNNPSFYPCTAHCKASVIYCSQQCRDSDILTHIHSGECHFLNLAKNSFPFHKNTCGSQAPQSNSSDSCSPQHSTNTCDSRAALRLLFHHENIRPNSPRIGNLMTNHEHLLGMKESRTAFTKFCGSGNNWDVDECEDYEQREVIQENAKLMHLARKHAKCGAGGDCCSVEELGLCVVITNGVDVQVDEEMPTRVLGGLVDEVQCFVIGTAVYGTQFSWCNHSCRPNACYRFVFHRAGGLGLNSKISGNSVLIEPGNEDYSDINSQQTSTRQEVYGPKAVLRTIRRVSKGEEIFITYTDLMQSMEARQMELWLKYGFVCHCERCDATLPSYTEQILQEVNAMDMTFSSRQNDCNETEAVKELLDEIKNGIDAFIFNGDADICCETLENLMQRIVSPKGFVTSENQLKSSDHLFRIHPLHHLCLDAYTTLASAYRISANNAVDCMLNKHDLAGESIKYSNSYRATAAYSLLLAGAVHHFFLAGEQGLIMKAGRFWLNAGEALARWILEFKFQTSLSEMYHHSIRNWVHSEFGSVSKCLKCDCPLSNDNIDVMPENLHSKSGFLNGKHPKEDARNKDGYPMLLRASESFHMCMNKLVNVLWPSLKFGFSFLEAIPNPLDYRWLTKSQRQQVLNPLVLLDKVEIKTNENEDEHMFIDLKGYNSCKSLSLEILESTYIFDNDGASLGRQMKHENFIAILCALHCFSYSRYLLEICYSSNHPLVNYIQNLLRQFSYGDTNEYLAANNKESQ